jgi:hypothetical protein
VEEEELVRNWKGRNGSRKRRMGIKRGRLDIEEESGREGREKRKEKKKRKT